MLRELWPGPERSLALILRGPPGDYQPEPDAIGDSRVEGPRPFDPPSDMSHARQVNPRIDDVVYTVTG
jgi:hypothetical protein